MQTAVIYARYSSDSQTEQSIDGQLRVCEEYAKNKEPRPNAPRGLFVCRWQIAYHTPFSRQAAFAA